MPTNALEQILATIGRSYTDLLISVPLVLAGILLTGTAYYLAFVRPHLEDRSLKGWLTYLFPPENYTSKSAKVDIAIWLINGLIFIPLFEASVLLAGLVIGVGFNDVLTNAFGPGPQATSAVWLLVVIQFFGFWFGRAYPVRRRAA